MLNNNNAIINKTTQISNELFEGYNDKLLQFAAIACTVFLVLGVPGNILTIIALTKGKQNRTATAIFIINLSISDLLFGCFNLPLAASTFFRRAWIHGDLLCRLLPLLRYGLLAVSLFTVSLITINRYIIIAHPRKYTRIYQRHYLAYMVMGAWLMAFLIMVPTWNGVWGKFGLDITIGSCSILPDRNGRSPKVTLFLLAFLVPCICIVFCYARILYLVRKAAFRTREPAKSPKNTSSNPIEQPINPIMNQQCNLVDDENLRPFTVNEDLEYIDDNYSFENLPISYEQISYEICADNMPPKSTNVSINFGKLFKYSLSENHFFISIAHTLQKITKTDENFVNSNPDKNQESFVGHHNTRKPSIKNSSTRLSSRKNPYVSMGNTSNASSIYPGRMGQKDRRLLKMILVIFISFVICYLPITITKIWEGGRRNNVFNISGYLLVYVTTCINPIIYVMMSSEYRQAYWNLLRCRCERSKHKDFKRPLNP
uniref:G-protein coupled receptors family 1 profile domain-containing protein n=1 Tax=Glossina brevipalpis TaxID=37001 RepID=A0A1A9X5L4_9MUSC